MKLKPLIVLIFTSAILLFGVLMMALLHERESVQEEVVTEETSEEKELESFGDDTTGFIEDDKEMYENAETANDDFVDDGESVDLHRIDFNPDDGYILQHFSKSFLENLGLKTNDTELEVALTLIDHYGTLFNRDLDWLRLASVSTEGNTKCILLDLEGDGLKVYINISYGKVSAYITEV